MAEISLRGQGIHTCGNLPEPGQVAPSFVLTKTNLKDVGLHDFAGKRKIISLFPSLDTPVCALSIKHFNETDYGTDTVILTVSADLPFAMQRFCKQNKVKNIIGLSMMRDRNFAQDYGAMMIDGPLAGLLARAVIVLDSSNKVIYSELVAELSNEPNYTQLAAIL
ncbi:Thiol peroxidase, Tpx-type [hydrothermal vent metagenome]|uniref:Thiol peroxidase, Tpx-type n=1 Tax=hydrothermal vent metagenome TaxID=652676 RepID=A0A3B0ZV93_9ZZZZ